MKCAELVGDRRRLFWATQPHACGSLKNCGQECGTPGLAIVPKGDGASISTENYVRGLVYNILFTDGRKALVTCGYTPGTRGGHWSDSFRPDQGQYSGSLMRFVKSTGRVRDDLALIKAAAEFDLRKLISYGVATQVEVTVTYAGRGRADLVAIVTGPSGETATVGASGSTIDNAWVWK